jgi:hypothetical protein
VYLFTKHFFFYIVATHVYDTDCVRKSARSMNTETNIEIKILNRYRFIFRDENTEQCCWEWAVMQVQLYDKREVFVLLFTFYRKNNIFRRATVRSRRTRDRNNNVRQHDWPLVRSVSEVPCDQYHRDRVHDHWDWKDWIRSKGGFYHSPREGIMEVQ